MMIEFEKNCRRVELHTLVPGYQHLKIKPSARQVSQMSQTLMQVGQLSPIVVLPQEDNWLLLDGYLRVAALKCLQEDVAMAEVWNCSESDALLALLTHRPQKWDVFEEAGFLQALLEQRQLTQSELAHALGRAQSWVSRRLSLLQEMPTSIKQAVLSGQISSWVAMRVLLPMARATKQDAVKLLETTKRSHYSTRQWSQFYQHYQQADNKVKARMVCDARLFFNVASVDEMPYIKPLEHIMNLLDVVQSRLQQLSSQPIAAFKELLDKIKSRVDGIKAKWCHDEP